MCSCKEFFMYLFFFVYYTGGTLTIAFGVFLLEDGKAFNQEFETTAYASFLIIIALITSQFPLLMMVINKWNLTGIKIYYACALIILYGFHIAHFVNYANGLGQFELEEPPANKADEQISNFLVAIFDNCCEQSNVTALVCDVEDPLFPCVTDIATLEEVSLAGFNCFDDEEFCEGGLIRHSNRMISRWNALLRGFAISTFVVNILMFYMNPLYIPIPDDIMEMALLERDLELLQKDLEENKQNAEPNPTVENTKADEIINYGKEDMPSI